MTPIKRGRVVDNFLNAAKIPMHMDKWLTSEQWVDIIKSLFNFNGKEEELDVKFLNNVLGKDERLKSVIDVHSNLNTSGIFRHRTLKKESKRW